MNFKATIKTNKLIITSSLPEDNYCKYTRKFIEEFTPVINNTDKLIELIQPLLNSKSWRLLNREIRRICNIYSHENKIMDVAVFQARWFYESIMYMRSDIGKNAPWVTDVQVKPQSPKNSAQATPAVKEKARKIMTEALIPESIEKGVKVASPGTRATAYGLTKEEIAEFGPYDMRKEWDRINFAIAKRIKMLD